MSSRGMLPLIVTAALAYGCALTPAQPGETRRDNRVLTTEEIQRASHSNLLDLVEAERPQWLRTRGSTTLQTRTVPDPMGGDDRTIMDQPGIVVYVDGTRFGGVSELRNFRLAGVSELRFLTASQATGRFGTDHTQGAILVTTGR